MKYKGYVARTEVDAQQSWLIFTARRTRFGTSDMHTLPRPIGESNSSGRSRSRSTSI